MATATTDTRARRGAALLVDAGIASERVLTAGERFHEALTLWNTEVESAPAVVVRTLSAQEVQAAVRAAAASGLPLSVRGGGHDWAGRALRDGGLVIDLTRMRAVELDGDVAVVAGGATGLDLISAAEPHGLTTAAGAVGAVGFAGLATGGGYGPLVGRLGLAADNLVGAQVVLADGRLVTADATHHPELFWALRGGGGNFGVVTELRVRLHPQTTPLRAGIVAFPHDQAHDVLRGYADIVTDAPDELALAAGLVSAPDGSPLVFVSPTWSGPLVAGQPVLDRIAALGDPVLDTVADTTYSALLRANDDQFGARGRWAIGTRSLASLTSDAVAALVEIGQARTSPGSLINMHHFHGAAARVPRADTAFGLRRDHVVVELIAAWSDDDAATHHAWIRGAERTLAPHALPGGYPNLLGADRHDQIAHAYGSNAARLLAAKDVYDPTGTFSGIPLPGPAQRST